MTMPVTAEKALSRLEESLIKADEPSPENEPTSEETAEEIQEPIDEEVKEPSEEPEAIKWNKEQQTEIDRLIQAESDKKSNTYRERHESNSELIKSLRQEKADMQRQLSGRTGETRLKKLMQDYDDQGYPEDGKKTFEEEIKEYNQKIDEYNQNSEQIESTVKFIDEMKKGLDPAIAKQFYLNDPNPNIRAGGGLELVNEAIANIKEYKNFLLVLEESYRNGKDVRQKFTDTVKHLSENETDFPTERSKRIYLSSPEMGFRPPNPRKAPPSPSPLGGGEDLSKLTMEDKIARHIQKADKK